MKGKIMADEKTPEEERATNAMTGDGGNINGLKKDISKGIKDITALKLKRKNVNDEIAAVKSKLEAKGISKTALMWGMKYLEGDQAQREQLQTTWEIVTEVVNENYQPSLLDQNND